MENESCGITVSNLIKWDPDFTKLTKSEATELSEAEKADLQTQTTLIGAISAHKLLNI